MRGHLLVLIAVACSSTPDAVTDEHDHEHPLPDDDDHGDSLPEGKEDGITVPSSLALDRDRVVYLTFDDGPSSIYTPRILDTLAAHDVRATFFVTGTQIAGKEWILRRARDEGHVIANHQWAHVIASSTQFRGWVTRNRDTLHAIVGAMPQYFRYPYGAVATWKEPILREEGYVDGGVGWDVDSLDWDFGPDEYSGRAAAAYRSDFEGHVLARVDARGGGVILFHDIQSVTANHLDSLLTRLRARGYRFGELPRTRGFIGDRCTVDAECAYAGSFCHGGLCTRGCTTTCPDRGGTPTTRCGDLDDALLCAADCSVTPCRAGQCVDARSPSGASRRVCWTP